MSSDIGLMLQRLACQASGDRMKVLRGPYLIGGIPEKPGQAGGTYAVATDARAIVFTTEWQPMLIPSLTGEQDGTRQKLLSHFAPPAHLLPSWEGRLADLRRACRDPIWTIACPECNALSRGSDYLHCSFCDNEGVVSPDCRPGYVYDIPLDLNRLSCVLEPFPGDALAHVIADPLPDGEKGGYGSRLWVISREFRLVVMGMRPAAAAGCYLFEEWQTAPRFPEMQEAKT